MLHTYWPYQLTTFFLTVAMPIQRQKSLFFLPKQCNTYSPIIIFSKKNDATSLKKSQQNAKPNRLCLVVLLSLRTSEELVRVRATDQIPPPPQDNVRKQNSTCTYKLKSQGDENSCQLSWNAKTTLFCHLCLIDRWIHIEHELLKASAEFSCPIKLSPKSKATAAEVFLLLLLPSHNKYSWGDHKCFGGQTAFSALKWCSVNWIMGF